MFSKELQQKQWFILERLHKYSPVFLLPPLHALTYQLGTIGLGDVQNHCVEYCSGDAVMIYLEAEWHGAAQKSFKTIVDDPSVIDALHKESDTIVIPKLHAFVKKVQTTDLKTLSNNELVALFFEWYEPDARIQVIRCPAWTMETSGGYLSTYLIDYLRGVVAKANPSKDPVLLFSQLTNPTKPTVATQERIDFLNLAASVQNGEIQLGESEARIVAHAKRYCHLSYGSEGPALVARDVVSELTDLLNSGVAVDPLKQIKAINDQFAERKKQQDELYKKLSIDEKHKHLLHVAQDIVFQKAWSKENQFESWYALDFVLREIARRLYLTVQQVRYMLPAEISASLHGTVVDAHILNDRFNYSLLCISGQTVQIVCGDEARALKAELNIKAEAAIDFDAKEFTGQTAVAGRARGIVRIVNKTSEISKMKPGDILVSEMTVPEIVAAMKKAAAIVTDMGGITCHAAIVSRELGIPCVIGTKVATRLLKDGDMVEVDAEMGIVRKL